MVLDDVALGDDLAELLLFVVEADLVLFDVFVAADLFLLLEVLVFLAAAGVLLDPDDLEEELFADFVFVDLDLEEDVVVFDFGFFETILK